MPASEQDAHKQVSGVASESVTCDACKRIFGSAQALTSHLKESHRCPGSSRYQSLSEEPARRVLKRSEASDALQQIQAMAGTTLGDEEPEDVPALRRLYIDFAHSISIGVHKEKYFLLMTLDGIDFTFCSATVDRTELENLIREFMTLKRLKYRSHSLLRRSGIRQRRYIQGLL